MRETDAARDIMPIFCKMKKIGRSFIEEGENREDSTRRLRFVDFGFAKSWDVRAECSRDASRTDSYYRT